MSDIICKRKFKLLLLNCLLWFSPNHSFIHVSEIKHKKKNSRLSKIWFSKHLFPKYHPKSFRTSILYLKYSPAMTKFCPSSSLVLWSRTVSLGAWIDRQLFTDFLASTFTPHPIHLSVQLDEAATTTHPESGYTMLCSCFQPSNTLLLSQYITLVLRMNPNSSSGLQVSILVGSCRWFYPSSLCLDVHYLTLLSGFSLARVLASRSENDRQHPCRKMTLEWFEIFPWSTSLHSMGIQAQELPSISEDCINFKAEALVFLFSFFLSSPDLRLSFSG